MNEYIAAFITGHSVRGCTGLSAEQRDFQIRSGIALDRWLPHNFPYHETFAFPEPFSLLSGSVNNVAHYFRSRFPAFRKAHRDSVAAEFLSCRRVILLAGSCGLELLNNLELPQDVLRRVHVFAYGPVSRRLPAVARCLVVQGTHDFISRAFHRKADHRFPCPHMGYLSAPETLRLFTEFSQSALCDL